MAIHRMFQEYLDDPKEVYVDQNPLMYWYVKMRQWPELSRLAKKYQACPVASVSAERVFSAAVSDVTVRRTSLSPQNVERLTMIKMNQHFIPHNYTVPDTTQEEENDWSESSVLADQLLSEPPEFEDELYFLD